MTTTNPRAVIGGNSPPDPIDTLTAPYADTIEEATNWLDGTPVTNEAQMKAVDALRAAMRQWRLALERGQKAATAIFYTAYKAELDRWNPTIDDAKRIEAGLVAVSDGFKRKLAAEKEATRKQAEAEAWAKTRAAQDAARLADAGNLEATRAAAQAMADAEAAQAAAALAGKDTVKGMRPVTRYEITDLRALLHYIAKNHRDDLTAAIEEWARKHHKEFPDADGLRVWTEKEGY